MKPFARPENLDALLTRIAVGGQVGHDVCVDLNVMFLEGCIRCVTTNHACLVCFAPEGHTVAAVHLN